MTAPDPASTVPGVPGFAPGVPGIAPAWLGPVAHIGLVADDFDAAVATLAATGVRWSSVTHPIARLERPDGRVDEHELAYVAAAGGEPRVKVIAVASGSVFAPGRGTTVHHLSYWVDDIATATTALEAAGWTVEATGREPDGSLRYRYLTHPAAPRIELGLTRNRPAFDTWADAPA